MIKTRDHWENIYASRRVDEVSWFQKRADLSLGLIGAARVPLSASIIDVGGGASRLVDDLLRCGYTALTVLDISASALRAASRRLGSRASDVQWLEADIKEASLPRHAYDLWHDRAVFHFLTAPADRLAYVDTVVRAVKPGGHLIVATFAEDGPEQCSGLPVMRYTAAQLHGEFGEKFELVRHAREAHRTPAGKIQHFVYCHCRKAASQGAARRTVNRPANQGS